MNSVKRVLLYMRPFICIFTAVLWCGRSPIAAEKPLVAFDFEDGLKNAGTLCGAGQLKTYATGEEASYELGPFGRCLDLTAASRHGGAGAKELPAGGAAVFRHETLDQLDTFTITLWSRQNPLMHGQNARLMSKDGAWDLLPHTGGATLALGPGASKVSYDLSGKTREKLGDRWRLDSAINIGFPAITGAFSLEVTAIQWVIVGYVLTHASLLLGCGGLADLWGHERVLICGLLVSAVGFACCGSAPSYGWLVGGRMIQGVGAALVFATAPALVTLAVPAETRGRALGVYQMSNAVGYAIGPLIGGILIDTLGWRATFLFRVAPALLLAALAAGKLPVLGTRKDSARFNFPAR